jgi:hypothetical protein
MREEHGAPVNPILPGAPVNLGPGVLVEPETRTTVGDPAFAPASRETERAEQVEELFRTELQAHGLGGEWHLLSPGKTAGFIDLAKAFDLTIHSTWSYRYEEALRVGRAIEELGFYWYEDPLADQDIYNYVKLKQKLDIPILATEYPIGGLDSYVPWILDRATDFLRGDVAVKGGITTLIKTAHLAEAFRMNFEVHHGGNSLNNVANLHVIMAIRNTEFFEVLLPDAMQKYGLAEEIIVDRDGLVRASTEPGLGAHIDFELIERKKLGVLS